MAVFEIFQSKHNRDHHVATLADDSDNAVGVRTSQNLTPLTQIADDNAPHLGVDRQAARRAITDHGFYAFAPQCRGTRRP